MYGKIITRPGQRWCSFTAWKKVIFFSYVTLEIKNCRVVNSSKSHTIKWSRDYLIRAHILWTPTVCRSWCRRIQMRARFERVKISNVLSKGQMVEHTFKWWSGACNGVLSFYYMYDPLLSPSRVGKHFTIFQISRAFVYGGTNFGIL